MSSARLAGGMIAGNGKIVAVGRGSSARLDGGSYSSVGSSCVQVLRRTNDDFLVVLSRVGCLADNAPQLARVGSELVHASILFGLGGRLARRRCLSRLHGSGVVVQRVLLGGVRIIRVALPFGILAGLGSLPARLASSVSSLSCHDAVFVDGLTDDDEESKTALELNMKTPMR